MTESFCSPLEVCFSFEGHIPAPRYCDEKFFMLFSGVCSERVGGLSVRFEIRCDWFGLRFSLFASYSAISLNIMCAINPLEV